MVMEKKSVASILPASTHLCEEIEGKIREGEDREEANYNARSTITSMVSVGFNK
jgi:hypothetical protein